MGCDSSHQETDQAAHDEASQKGQKTDQKKLSQQVEQYQKHGPDQRCTPPIGLFKEAVVFLIVGRVRHAKVFDTSFTASFDRPALDWRSSA